MDYGRFLQIRLDFLREIYNWDVNDEHCTFLRLRNLPSILRNAITLTEEHL
jgi:hypothetical protein